MKKVIMMASLLFGVHAIAQNIEMDLGDFHEIKVYDLINVELVKDNQNKAVITGDNVNDVEIVNKNGLLKIRMRFGENFDGNKTVVTLYYKTIDIIDVNEGSYVTSENLIQQDRIELRAQEGAVIKLDLDVTKSEIKTVTGGEIEVSGKAERQKISINTGGIFQGRNLESESTYVAIRAGGEAYINASDLVDVKIRAGGNVYIYGQPAQINENKMLGGTIKRMDGKP